MATSAHEAVLGSPKTQDSPSPLKERGPGGEAAPAPNEVHQAMEPSSPSPRKERGPGGEAAPAPSEVHQTLEAQDSPSPRKEGGPGGEAAPAPSEVHQTLEAQDSPSPRKERGPGGEAAPAPSEVHQTLEGQDSPSPRKERGPGGEAYVVVANLPYNIGAAVLRHFLEAAHPPTHMVVMLQREVADSICAAPGDLGLLGVSVQVYAEAESLFHVPAKAFEPPPRVTSSVIRLDIRSEPLVDAAHRDAFFAMVRAGFSAPRKQLPNTLAQGLRRAVGEMRELILAAGLAPTMRPQELSIADWQTLTAALGAQG